jgi:hypothetical protein
MYVDILLELFQAIGRFFINPLCYIAIIFAVFLGYRRVKRERKSFNIRILSGWLELKNSLLAGLIVSLILSFVMIAVGLTMTPEFLLVLMASTVLGLVLYTFYLISHLLVDSTTIY